MIRLSTDATVPMMGKPRASGDDPVGPALSVLGGDVNPARAGMIRPEGVHRQWGRRKPRASGDDPDLTPSKAPFSP